ncbi:12754_t:CDS:2, partial [Dentiscutata erythropus]
RFELDDKKHGITSPLVGARTKAQLVKNHKAFELKPIQMTTLDAVSELKRYAISIFYVSKFK